MMTMPLGVLMKMLMLMLSGLCSNRGKWCWEGSPNPPLTIKLDTQRVLQAQCQKRLFVFKIIVRRAYSSKIFPHKLQEISSLSAIANTLIQDSIVKLKENFVKLCQWALVDCPTQLICIWILFVSSDRSSYSDIVLLYAYPATFWDFEHFCQYILSYDFLSWSMLY